MRGKRISFPKNRRLVIDVCREAKSIPAFPVDRHFQLLEVKQARERTETRISWASLFLKAYGMVCREKPELRQVFVRYPWTRLYEHPNTVASISVHRRDPKGGERLIWARIGSPEDRSLVEIQAQLDYSKIGPLDEVFKDGMRIERLPAPIRRLTWWLMMKWHGRQHAKRVGTFSLSTLAGEDAWNRGHPLVVTSSLAYSRCDEKGECLVTLLSDHRVIDGVLAARSLKLLEEKLRGEIVAELTSLSNVNRERAA